MHASEIGNLDIFKLIRALATLSAIGIGNVAKIANRHASETGNLDFFYSYIGNLHASEVGNLDYFLIEALAPGLLNIKRVALGNLGNVANCDSQP